MDLSWVNDQWWKLLTGYTNRKDYPEKIDRRNFKTCVLYQIMYELKSGDLCIKDNDIYSDYREQLISWEEYHANISLFGEQVNIPVEGKSFVEFAKNKLEQISLNADKAFPDNEYLRIKKMYLFFQGLKRKNNLKI